MSKKQYDLEAALACERAAYDRDTKQLEADRDRLKQEVRILTSRAYEAEKAYLRLKIELSEAEARHRKMASLSPAGSHVWEHDMGAAEAIGRILDVVLERVGLDAHSGECRPIPGGCVCELARLAYMFPLCRNQGSTRACIYLKGHPGPCSYTEVPR